MSDTQTSQIGQVKRSNIIMRRVEFYIAIILFLVSVIGGWFTLQSKVVRNDEILTEAKLDIKVNEAEIKNVNESIGQKLDDINDLLNHAEYGLPVLKTRLDNLER